MYGTYYTYVTKIIVQCSMSLVPRNRLGTNDGCLGLSDRVMENVMV